MSTTTTDQSKDAAARRLADTHYLIDPSITRIFRLMAPQREADADEPIKLLEVNVETTMSGIVPLAFGPHPPSGLNFRSIIVEIRPEELDPILRGDVPLPDGWRVGAEYARPEQP